MNNNIQEYLTRIKNNSSKPLSREEIITEAILNVKRLIIELQELENIIMSKSNNTFATIILGTQLEHIKCELIEIKHKYQKK